MQEIKALIAPEKVTAEIRLEVEEALREQFEELEWDFAGFPLATVTATLKDIRRSVAILSATIEPQLCSLEMIRLARDLDSGTTHLVLVLRHAFEDLQRQFSYLLEDEALDRFEVTFNTNRIIPVAELPDNGDLTIPSAVMSFMQQPLVFDRLVIETETDIYYHTF